MYVRNLIASDRRSPINLPTTSLSGPREQPNVDSITATENAGTPLLELRPYGGGLAVDPSE